MARKRVLLSLLEPDDGLARLLGQELAKAGLDVAAHFWDASTERMAWGQAAKELSGCSAWVVAGRDFTNLSARKTLALAALAVQAEKGVGFPILLSPESGTLEAASLPDPLKGAEIVKNGLGTKAAVQAATMKTMFPDYRLVPMAPTGLGLWFETGPRKDPWQGAFFAGGARDSEKAVPTVHGVGRAGTIPARCTLRYPIEGMKLEVRGIACEGWGAKNELTPDTSYYVRMGGIPDVVAFGAFPDRDDAELFTVNLA